MTSCMRLSVRRKVDFPQPDGPIRAVTRLASTVSETFSMARVDRYQALTPITSIDLDMVLPGRSYETARAPWTLDARGVAGMGAVGKLTDGLGAWALGLALAALVVGAALWAVGAHAQNFQQSLVGRRAVLVSGLAALLIGAAPALVNFFFHAGT